MFYKYCLRYSLFIYLWNYSTLMGFAQIIPDNSLGGDRSIASPNAGVDNNTTIEGGAVRDDNLFHSFSEFNVSDRGQVYFASPTGIENIITRVTGNNVSKISGTLGVDGDANLFLLNPNGIIFHQNSQLDIAGSFLATTADSYIFANGSSYGAIDPQAPALLTVNIPAGLQFGSTPGSIVNRANTLPDNANSETSGVADLFVPEGLRINSGQTLSLIGGEVELEGGYLNTSQGRIELGGVGTNEEIQLIAQGSNWIADYEGVSKFADIQIHQQGGIDGGDTGGSQITLTGKNISLGYDLNTMAELGYEVADFFSFEPLPVLDKLPSDQAEIVAHNQHNSAPSKIAIAASDTFSIIDPGKLEKNILTYTSGSGDAGEIEIVGESIILYGASLESSTLAGATGGSGAINFSGQNMSVQYGGGGVNTFSRGHGGLIYLDIAKNVKIQLGGFGAEVRNSGDGGKIQIDTETLEIQFGGFGVSTFASGDGGTIDLNIGNRLTVVSGGFGADAFDSGAGGNIFINARNLELIDAGMGVNTRGEGTGGEIKITAKTILLKNGIMGAQSGQIDLDQRVFDENGELATFNTRNAGNGGNISIEAEGFIIDNGDISTSTVGKGNAGNIDLQIGSLEIVGRDLITGINSSSDGTGKAGNIKVISNSLELSSEGIISVDGGEIGLPGNIDINSKNTNLNQGGTISATTNQGTQGNITISGDNLFLSDRSAIVTDAAQDATGGNVFIDLNQDLLGVGGSKITASAENGQGGNIEIAATGIFLDADSQISAGSDFGVDGLIQISTLAVDISSGLIQLPTKPIDSSLYLSKGCGTQSQHEFVSVGRGGLPQNPLDRVIQNSTIADLGHNPATVDSAADLAFISASDTSSPIVEAQNWKINQQGKVELVATVNRSNLADVRDGNNCLR